MLESILLLIFSYLVLSYLGFGIFALITPDAFKKPYLYALISPGFGFFLLVIVGSWVVATNTAITWTMILSLVIATGLNLLVLWRANIREKISIKRFRVVKKPLLKILFTSVFLLGILFLIILPGVREGKLTTPLRLGPDSIGYAGAAQTLVEGGTLSSIAEELKAVTGKEDLEEAKEANFQLLRFDLHCSSEFLLKALRWGYPNILANMTWVTGLDSVYRLDFVLLVFSWAMLLGLAYYACRIIIKARWYICLLLTAVLALNCNLLNIYYEGSYAEVMAIPIFFMLLLYLYHIRESNTFENKRDQIKQVAFVGFLCAALLSIWTEAFIILAISCFIILVFDLLQVHKMQKAWVFVFGFGALFAFILIAPFTWNLILFYKNYLFDHLGNITQGGWWQPQWATLPEIMGWTNIYAHGSQPALVQRSTIEVIIAFLGSILVLAAAEFYIFSKNKYYRSFWLASIIFIGLIYLKCALLDRSSNYQYYKAYTAYLPIIFLLIFAAIFYLTSIISSRWKYVLYGIVAVCIGMTVYNGVSYIKMYNKESGYVTEEMFAFKKYSEPLSNYVLMTPYGPNYYQTTQMAGTIKLNLYNFSFEDSYGNTLIKEPYFDKTVAIVLFYDDIDQYVLNIDDAIYSGDEFLIVETPYKLKDKLDEQGNVNINNYLNLEDMRIDASVIFTDEVIGKEVAAEGDTYITKDEKKFGTGSVSFDGNGDYLTVKTSANLNFGSDDFTIDGWFYFKVNDIGHQYMLDRRGNADGTGWIFYLESDNTLSFLSASSSPWDNKALFNTGVVPEAGKWIHLAVVRRGDVFTMYQNGIAIKSGIFAGRIGAQKTDLTIGSGHVAPGEVFNGYIDELRISKGIARWTADFTPPAAPYADVDTYTKLLLHFDAYTKLLLHFDGINGSTDFTDEIGNKLVTIGDAYVSEDEKKFGASSVSFEGQGNYLKVKNSTDFDFGSDDFTIDGWFYFKVNDIGYQFMLDRRGNADGTGWIFYLESDNTLSFLSASSSPWDNKALFNTGVVPEAGKWIHLAVVRHGDVFTMYQNGIAIKSGIYEGAIGTQTTDLCIGGGPVPGEGFIGYIDELRISKGIARWTANFMPPAAPYADTSNTESLDEKGTDLPAITSDVTVEVMRCQNNLIYFFINRTYS